LASRTHWKLRVERPTPALSSIEHVQ
jgi:hypothetical protein